MRKEQFNEIKKLFWCFLYFLALALCVALTTLIPYVDVFFLNNKVAEISLTEALQEVLVALNVGLLLWLASRKTEMKEAFVLWAFLFFAIWIREMDFLFDLLFHGAWSYLMTALFIVFMVYVYRHIDGIANSLSCYFRSPNSGFLVCGLLMVLVVSRICGAGFFWESVLSEHYTRVVKNMAEEGMELIGYTFCLIATVLFLVRKER